MVRSLAAFLLLLVPVQADLVFRAESIRLPAAQEVVRSMIAGGLDGPLTVQLHGRFEIDAPLQLGPEDSGTETAPVTWEGYDAVISGGRRIPLKKDAEGRMSGQVGADFRFRELFAGDRRLIRARHPNQGYLRAVEAALDNRTGLRFKAGELPAIDSAAGMELVFLHDWSTSRITRLRIDHAERWIRTDQPIGPKASHYAITHFEKHPRYYLEHHAAFLDQEGEWLLEPGGLLRVLGGMDAVVAPKARGLIRAEGLKHVRFKNIAFQHAAWPLPPGGYAAGQAAFHERRDGSSSNELREFMPAALHFEQCESLQLETCRFSQLGASGLWIGSRCKQVAVTHCVFSDISGNALMLGEDRNRKVPGGSWADQAPGQAASALVVEDNLIEHCGAQFFGSVGIWVGMARDTVIRHNTLRHLPYTGISLGWMWNPRPTPCGGHRVERNHIHHVMQVLSDGGGIYTLGRQPGTQLRENLIHDIPLNMGRAESNGMFLDQGSSELLIESNVVFRIDRSPFRFHQALENMVRGNRVQSNGSSPLIAYNRTEAEHIQQAGNTISPPEAPFTVPGGPAAYGRREP